MTRKVRLDHLSQVSEVYGANSREKPIRFIFECVGTRDVRCHRDIVGRSLLRGASTIVCLRATRQNTWFAILTNFEVTIFRHGYYARLKCIMVSV